MDDRAVIAAVTMRDRFSRPLIPLAAFSGVAALGYFLLAPAEARAACVQTGNDVACAGVDGDGFISTESVTVHVQPDALVGNVMTTRVTGRCPLSLPGISVGASSHVSNEGTISTFGVCAFGIMAENGSAITNSGTILTHDLIAYGILTGDNVTIRTSGRIATEYQGSGGIFGGGGMRVAVEADGTITTAGIGANGIEVGSNALVVNDGAIVVRGDASFGIAAAAGSTIANTGSVETGGSNSIGVQVVSGTLTNAGRVRSLLSGPARALTPTVGVSVVGTGAHFINAANGVVEATHIGVRLDGAQDAALSNAGRIEVSPARQIDGTMVPDGAAVLAASAPATEVFNTGLIIASGGLPALRSLGPQVTLSNSGTIAGDVLLAAGNDVVIYRAGSSIDGTIDFGPGEDTLIFQGTGTLGAPVLNAELLSKSGAGNLTLARDLTVRRQVNIFDGGGIVVNQGVRLTSAATGNLGLLRGAGTIDGPVTNSGTLAPGTQAAKGTLTVTGAFQQFAGGTLAVRLSPDGSSDRLLVGGPATLAGTLALSYEGTAFRDGQRFDVVTPLSGSLARTGQFTLAAPDLAFVKAGLVASSSGGVTVEIDRLSYSTAGVSAGQQSVGLLFDRLQTSPPPALSTTLQQLEFSAPGTATAILEDFTAEGPGGVQNLGLLTLARFGQGLRRYAPTETRPGHFAWARGFSSAGRSRGAASASAFDLHGMIAGLDMTAGDVRLGVAAARTDGDFARGPNAASLNTSLIAVRAGTTWSGVGVEAVLAYGRGAPQIQRTRTSGEILSTDADSNLWSARLEGTYEMAFGPMTFSPHAGAAYQRVGVSAIDEGRALSVRTTDDALSSLRARFGAGVGGAAGSVRPYGDLSLSVELLQRMPRISAGLVGVPESGFELHGDARRRLAVEAEAGLAVTITPELEGYVAGTMTANDLLAGRALTAGLTYRW